jgi:hypothetical protein
MHGTINIKTTTESVEASNKRMFNFECLKAPVTLTARAGGLQFPAFRLLARMTLRFIET